MAEQGWFSPTYVALNQRFLNKKLAAVLTGGWNLIDLPEKNSADPKRGVRPYGAILPKAVRDTRFTNASKYATLEFSFYLVADTFTELDAVICPAVTAILQNMDRSVLPTGSVNITMIRPGDIEYVKEEQIWTGELTFYVQANQPASPSAT